MEYYKQDIGTMQLVPSDGGRFEVSVNDQLIFSKLEEDRFPEYKEIKKEVEKVESSVDTISRTYNARYKNYK